MSTQISPTSVTTSTIVNAPIEHAFSVFTEGIGTWWPPEQHLLKGELAEMVFEPHEGGYIYDRAVDGTESRWARVIVYEPPDRVVFSWNINLRWEIEPDPDRTSEVEVRFHAQGPDRTEVTLEHRNFERHGEGWEAMRDAVGSSGGWNLRRFAEVAESS